MPHLWSDTSRISDATVFKIKIRLRLQEWKFEAASARTAKQLPASATRNIEHKNARIAHSPLQKKCRDEVATLTGVLVEERQGHLRTTFREHNEITDLRAMATSAEPVLASSLYDLEDPAQKVPQEREGTKRQPRLKTSSKAIDKALNGGFDFGVVHCITGEDREDGQDLIRNLLAPHLLASEEATATVVDCTLAFDVRKLHKIIQTSLPLPEHALQTLGRLKIMKIFDYTGLTEAIAEVREHLEHKPAPRATISDSEDEEDLGAGEAKSVAVPSRELLIVTNLTHILAPMIRTSYVQGQAALTSLMRLFGHLAKTQDVCVMVFGDAHAKKVAEAETLSMFQSCLMRSGLGDGIGHLVDTHFYLHKLPRKKPEISGKEAPPKTHVLEMVQDRYGDRFGQWAAFEFDADGRMKDIS
ncbi:hypothetical protein AC579_3521 [Pseudocercospora musae]|uniref:DNA recombination and repair protein Rad51-like C-terminal domain-containing protein n=1 Tax=Pseudocercospora musae TaxID=113226 RepID=A0A139IVZ8_9PEZI|nr:hypothetical protein AC579_3521 [Pseudocercospora musae]